MTMTSVNIEMIPSTLLYLYKLNITIYHGGYNAIQLGSTNFKVVSFAYSAVRLIWMINPI